MTNFEIPLDIQGVKIEKVKINSATNLKRDTFRHFGSIAIPQSSKI